MSIFTPTSREFPAYIITAGGGARSGKGTSMEALQTRLRDCGHEVTGIDQGVKFRAMALAAIDTPRPIDLDDESAVTDFLSTSKRPILNLLSEIAGQTPEERKALLYTSELSEASAKVARTPSSHKIAIALLRSEVSRAVYDGVDGVIIDGRAMDQYARGFAREGLGQRVMDWHFTCNPLVAARRSIKVFGDQDSVDPDEWRKLLDEEARIAARNQTDMQRAVDPLRTPSPAYEVPSLESAEITCYGIARSTLRKDRMAVLDTTNLGLEKMTRLVSDVTVAALQHEGFIWPAITDEVEYA